MLKSTLHPHRDPLGTMMRDYLAGDQGAAVRVSSPLLEMSEMTGKTMFRTGDRMNGLERRAMALCRGRILDVGAGSGCHSLALQDADQDVTALEVSPGCMQVLEARGVRQRKFASLFSLKKKQFNTLLMLMNGIGICGSIQGLNFFLQHIRQILHHGGQVIADSTDLAVAHTDLPLAPDSSGGYYGETEFTMSYKKMESDPFDWLYIDYATLAFYAEFHGWRCDRIMEAEDGKFLARIH